MTASGKRLSTGVANARGLVARAFHGPHAAGFASVLERIAASPRDSFAVLTYHRVDRPDARPWLNPSLLSATPAGFEAQMTALLRRHQPISLSDLLAAHRSTRRPLPERAVLVTFDDGYRDFIEHPWPVLRRLGIPATLFVPTSYPDADRPFWWDRLWRALREAPAGTLHSPAGRLDLDGAASRRAAARVLIQHHKRLLHDDAMASVDQVIERLSMNGSVTTGATTAVPSRVIGARRARGRARPGGEADVLGWDEIRGLAAAGLDVAAHSRSHPLLTRLTPEAMEAEAAGSRDDLEQRLGKRAFANVFAYPAGAHSDQTRDALAHQGFELAFTTDRGINVAGESDPLALRRINIGLRSGPDLVRAEIAFFTLRYRTRGI